MNVGFFEIDITPRIPCRMIGYAARKGGATGVHDPIRARVAVFDDRLAVVSLDWCRAPRGIVERIRRGCGLPYALVAATHTHAGPRPSFVAVPKILRAIREARRNATDRPARFGRAPLRGVGANRRRRGGPCDPEVRVLDFGAGRIVNHACHLTTLPASNRSLSADFPGLAAETFPGVTLFLNGAAGDVSTRFTRRGQSYAEVRRFARLLAAAVRRAVSAARPVEDGPVRVSSRTLRFRARPAPAPKAVREAVAAARRALAEARRRGLPPGEVRRFESRVEGARVAWKRPVSPNDGQGRDQEVPPTFIFAEIQAIRLGPVSLVAVPFELMAETGRRILRRHDLLAGYANGYAGYLPTDRRDDYENLVSAVAPGEWRRVEELVG